MSSVSAFTLIPGTAVVARCPQNTAAIKLTNGSAFDLSVWGFGSNGIQIIPAGTEYMLDGSIENSGQVNFLPVNNVNATGNGVANLTFFIVGEQIPSGHWPVTVPVQVVQAKVSTITSLINDGNAIGTQIIESTALGSPSSETSVTNDGLWVLKVLVSGVLHQFLKSQNTGNPLLLGQAGDTAEALGTFLVDQILNVTGATNLTGLLSLAGGIGVTGAIDLIENVPTGHQYTWQVNAATVMSMTNALLHVFGSELIDSLLTVTGAAAFNAAQPSLTVAHGISLNADGNAQLLSNATTIMSVDATNKNLLINAPNTGAGGKISFQIGGVEEGSVDASGIHVASPGAVFFTTGSITRYTRFLGTGNGTVATGITNPFQIFFNPCSVSGSSQTIGGTNATSSVVTTGAGLAWVGSATN